MSNQQLEKKEISHSERFMNMVVANFSSGVSEVALTNFQKRLAQNYFIALDAALRAAEDKRLAKSERNRDPIPVTWQNVNMEKLARDVVTYARVGFDPAQRNHINLVPFKNNKTGKYDIGFVEGYRGMELKAVKYGLSVPDNVVIEVVCQTDRFKSIKKDRNNKYDTYEFEITNEFDRGEIVGGFYYHEYYRTPEKNKLVVMSLKDILKRRPPHASPEFWGGEKDVWENGKKVGKQTVDGWYEKMVWKTIARAAYGDVTIDSQKIDDDYMRLSLLEEEFSERSVEQEIAENGNREVIDVTPEPPEPSEMPDTAKKRPASKTSGADPEQTAPDVGKPPVDEELEF